MISLIAELQTQLKYHVLKLVIDHMNTITMNLKILKNLNFIKSIWERYIA